MLKKYTKYVATAFAVASLSTFIIGCAEEEEEDTGPTEDEVLEEPESVTNDGANDGAAPLDGE
jgi:hypothetical protein